MNAYEVGRRRMPVSSLPVIARYLGVAIEELIGESPLIVPGAGVRDSSGLADQHRPWLAAIMPKRFAETKASRN